MNYFVTNTKTRNLAHYQMHRMNGNYYWHNVWCITQLQTISIALCVGLLVFQFQMKTK